MPYIISVLTIIIIILAVFAGYFLIGQAPKPAEIIWGVNFSQKHATDLGLDWQKTYLALLDDLKVKNVKLLTHWDLLEPTVSQYNFDDLDWQVRMAKERGVNIILVIGMKTGRWPECHIPSWAKGLDKKEQQANIVALLRATVSRYQKNDNIKAWQVENEPFFPFGHCPWTDKNFVKLEVALVKSLDQQKRPVILSESGEGSAWFSAAKLGDKVAVTIYRKSWFTPLGMYIHYPLPPIFYWRKAQLIKTFFNKDVFCGELQAEPWCPNQLYNCSSEEQAKTMDLAKFKNNIGFAKRAGLKEFYFWGAEWWYWLKEKQNNPQIWQEAKRLWP